MATNSRAYVVVTDKGIAYHRTSGDIEAVDWADLRTVLIETTDGGPYFPDVFWILIGDQGGCVIPQGIVGEEVLAERLLALPGFDQSALIEAMSSTTNQRFLCWRTQHNK